MKIKAFIVAGNHREYLQYTAKKKLNTLEYPYVYNKMSLTGQRDIDIIKVGTYARRVDWTELRKQISYVNI